MPVLRTPDERFAHLPGFPFEPNYLDVGTLAGRALRAHYVDEGPRDADPVVLMHGEPSWSYLYRKMIPVIAGAGFRAIAPDLIGFGRSDKPADRADYTYARHVEWMHLLLRGLDLRNITLVCQDWGGLIGLRLVAEDPDRFARVVAANTGLPTGDQRMSETWLAFKRFCDETPAFPVGPIVAAGCLVKPPDDVVAAYDAPFPDESFKAGPREFPSLIPTTPDDPAAPANRMAWEVLGRWSKPFLTAFSDSDPITRGADAPMRERIPGARGRAHVTIEGAGHFLQEDKGEEFAKIVVGFVRDTSP